VADRWRELSHTASWHSREGAKGIEMTSRIDKAWVVHDRSKRGRLRTIDEVWKELGLS
jgi:hypothetical protein